MADTPVEIFAPSGLGTLTLKLFPYGSDAIANGASGDDATEETNRKGLYIFTVAESLAGWYTAHLFLGATLLGYGHVLLADTTDVHRVLDSPVEGLTQQLEEDHGTGSWLSGYSSPNMVG